MGMPGIVIKIGANTQEAIDGINRVDKALGRAGTGGAQMKALAVGLGAAAAAAGVLAIKLGVDGVQAAIDDQAELAKLNTVLTNLGFGDRAAELQTWIDNLQFSANVSESELRPALQVLVTSTRDVTKAQQLMQLALDLSASGFGSVQDAANALSKAVGSGNVARLNAFTKGALDPAIVKSKDLDGALQSLSATFAGAATARTATFASKLEGLKIAASELSESLGQGIIDGFLKSLGGSSGNIDDTEAAMRNMQGTVEDLGKAIGGLGAGFLTVFGTIREVVTTVVYNVMTAMNDLYMIYIDVADALGIMSDEEAMLERARMANVYDAQERAYQEDLLGSAYDKTGAAAAGAAAAAGQYADGAEQAAGKTDEATTAAGRLAEALKTVDGRWATKDARLQFLDYLDQVNGKFDKGSKKIGDHTQAGRDNQRVLMDGYSAAMTAVQLWADQTDASQEEILVKQDSYLRRLRKKWIDSGLSREDVDKWLAANTGWTPAQATLIKNAKKAGIDIGEALMNGTIQGLRNRVGAAQAMATTAINKVTANAELAGGISSPSKVWARIGMFLGEGLALGIKNSTAKTTAAATTVVNKTTAKAAEAALKVQTALTNKHIELLNGYMDTLRTMRDEAQSYASSVSSSLTGGISLSAAFTDGADPKTALKSYYESIAQAQTFSDKLGQMAYKLPKTPGAQLLIQQILDLGSTAGVQFLNGMGSELPNMAARLDALIGTSNGTGDILAYHFYGEGIAAQEQLVAGMAYQIEQDEKKLRELGAKIGKPIGEEIKAAITEALNAAATALGTTFIESGAGTPTIVNNTINTGVGDPVAIGREIVSTLERYNARTGGARR